ncbi:MAG TPA: glycosyltransferase family 2 protein [Thermoanaerobaculia bacterium]|nr:glycosyltransferase family 2 protein [Thermoanaerobaculia bacterium]
MSGSPASAELGRVAVAIPAYQAERWIADVVAAAFGQLDDVLVVDDGSTDATGERARAAGAEVLRVPVNRGKGAALRRAFSEWLGRDFDAVVTLDADGQHLPSQIPHLLAGAAGADLVLGSRDHLFRGMGGVRRWSNTLSSRAISFGAGLALPDVQTGFRLYRRRLIEAVPLREDRFEAESAVVVRAARRGLRVRCVPVELGFVDGRHTSHYRPLLDSLRIARAVVAARFERGE